MCWTNDSNIFTLYIQGNIIKKTFPATHTISYRYWKERKRKKERKKETDHGMQSARVGQSHAGGSFHNQRPSFYVASRSRRQSWVLYLSAPSSVFIYPRLPQSATAPTAPQSSPQLHSHSAAATETPTSSSMIITSARTTATGPAACLWPAPCREECVAVVVAVLWTSGG